MASPNFREPAPFAKELMTLDDISGGRLTLGFGAGADGFDATAIRHTPWSVAERQARFAEFVGALDRLLSDERANHDGPYYVANEVRSIPGCVQKPRIPFALAATGKRGLSVVARYAQTWVSVDSRGAGAQQMADLTGACDTEGRDHRELAKLVLLGFSTDPLQSVSAALDLADQYEARGYTDVVFHWPRDTEPFAGKLSVLERFAVDRLGA